MKTDLISNKQIGLIFIVWALLSMYNSGLQYAQTVALEHQAASVVRLNNAQAAYYQALQNALYKRK